MNLPDYLIMISFVVLVVMFVTPVIAFIGFYIYDRRQKQHSVLRNYPLLGRIRYFFEMIGPELRQYFFDHDLAGKPFSRVDFQSIVLASKYLKTIIGFGSRRDFEKEGYYLKNVFFPKQEHELKVDHSQKVSTLTYRSRESLISRKDTPVMEETSTWLLDDDDAVVIGETCRHPFVLKGLIGMSGMSYGALGERAISALSLGLADAGGTWMNTGEGGLSPHHLKGNVDLIFQIGPGLFGVRDEEGNFSWDELKKKAENPRVRAFELKLGQGAKIRGGHVEGKKVTPEIARIRGVKPYQTIDSPNRFKEFDDIPSMLEFIEKIREVTGKPVGIKIVIGDQKEFEALTVQMKAYGKHPDFITVDGGEGGTGATYIEMADSVGLPVKSALMIAHSVLKKYGLRRQIKIIASGKLFTADRIAVALGMGADLVNIARGFMISIGCISAQKCHTNECPVGVATTDPNLQKALVIEEKRYRVLNYLITLRKGLYMLAAAAGLDSPVNFSTGHVIYKDGMGRSLSLEEIYEGAEYTLFRNRMQEGRIDEHDAG
ncbi:MAG: FMN-binding glutamate synthase family protein [Bacillaceae bacterium]|nr:FMN-binding glutamate synthase family protein [Bacillaceae bacterium]